MMNIFQQFMQNPQEMLRRKYNIPGNVNMNNPNDIIQHLLNSGQVSQNDVNRVMQMRNNPMIQNMIRK